ncbi:hypothetical protein PHLGIDRAFT_129433 [Phlebiopsis gigantea 11061_1 CR5-6]|uniref:Uncharacterized protein n=1 Tax=Phlebiopsis gigantea (strain 11061_1 CR5-6) TaxID=745531 RepID=A0A0C3RUB8_PHLG1|nr:hypothetical protein PHLGIDRAFT_129433 [Phlebiopsis gigantea 11061_1 CR5-6]
MLSWLVNKPNRVYEMQRLVQTSKAAPHLALPRSHLYVYSYYGLFTVGMGGVLYGCYALIAGKKKE